MSDRKIREVDPLFQALLIDPEDPDAGFKPAIPPVLDITSRGEQVGKERSQKRFLVRGTVFLYCSNRKLIRAKCRDLSLSGVGVDIASKLVSYRIGEQFTLEFAPPHVLQALLIRVELTRYSLVEGHNHLGFRIVTASSFAKRKLKAIIAYLIDPWGA